MSTGTGMRVGVRNSGVKTLMPGSPATQPSTTVQPFIYEAAQVEDVVVNEASNLAGTTGGTANTGRVKIRFANTQKGLKSEELPWADPLIPYQTMYPLKGEHVLVFKMLGSYWYVGPLNTKRRINQNASPLTGLLQTSAKDNIRDARATAAGITTKAQADITRVGDNFRQLNVNPIKAFEGDVIYQGRYGNSIRLGSSQMVGSANGEQNPNIILRVGQSPATSKTMRGNAAAALTNESLNTDASSIWMVSKQILGLVPATYGTNVHMRSVLEKPIFDGASILLNSDRILVNAKATSIFMFAKKGIHLNSLEDGFTVDTSGPVVLRTPNNLTTYAEKTLDITSKEDILITTKRDVSISGDRNITIMGNEIFLGGRSSKASPIAMAKPLKMFMYELLRTLMSTQPLTLGLSGVVNPALIARLLVVYAKYMVLPDPINPTWASNDNFVMKSNERTMASDLPPNESFKRVSGIGAGSSQQAFAAAGQLANNPGLKDLSKLYNAELLSKI